MATTTYKGAYLPTVSGDSGTWGTQLNANTFPIFDTAIGGYLSISPASVTLSAAQDLPVILRVSGTLSGDIQIISPCKGFKIVENATSGNHAVTIISSSGGSAVTLPQSASTLVFFDSTNGARSLSPSLPTNASISGTLSVTGTSTLTGALSVASSATLTEIATPSSPSSGKIALYGYAGDYLASLTPGGVQKLYGKDPTVQRFTSGSGTYTPTTGTVRIRVRMVAGGSGGSSSGMSAVAGTAGGNTTLGSWTTVGGQAPASISVGGVGGTGGTNGTGTVLIRIPGQSGARASGMYLGACGGNSFLGSGGPLVFGSSSSGNAGTGYGAGGGGASSASNGSSSGAGGEYAEFMVLSPGALSYAVGSAGSGGTGVYAGGNGTAGIIIIEEYYN